MLCTAKRKPLVGRGVELIDENGSLNRARVVRVKLRGAERPTPPASPRPLLVAKPVVAEAVSVRVRPIPRWKRLIDLAGASVGLVLGLPLLLMIAVCVKCTSRGPVIFRQRRAGLDGAPFLMWKFRTMTADADARKKDLLPLNERQGPAFKLSNDPRVTLVGRFLRRTSLDELPQLWNVLRGEMSLVGPRPLPCAEAAACQPWQRRRMEVTPGLTCLWQVSGRSQASFDHWVQLDLAYIERRSFITDVRILLATIPAVLLGRGAC